MLLLPPAMFQLKSIGLQGGLGPLVYQQPLLPES
jgi:hypothetical protein